MDITTLEPRSYHISRDPDPLSKDFRVGLIPVALFATLSLLSVSALLLFITNRLVSWRKHYRQYVGYNQYVILIFNLLIADLQQAIAFTITFHWLNLGKIMAPSAPCFIQAWFLQIGDVSSGFFVLAIAVHTWLGVVKGYKVPYLWFVLSILCIWAFALLLTLLGPAMYKSQYFSEAGGWCWVSAKHQGERLWLHYLWIFIVEIVTVVIYAHICIHLRGRISSILANGSSGNLTRATKFMVMYPAAYVVLTLPIAVGRTIAMTGVELPDTVFCITGSLLASCGWIDALLYTMTRRVLTSQDLSGAQYSRTHNTVTVVGTNAIRPGDDEDPFDLQTIGSKTPINTAARTVTIVGGRDHRLSRALDHRGAQTRPQIDEDIRSEDNPSRNGSQDSIYKSSPRGNKINIKTETNIQVETNDEEFDVGRQRLKSWSGVGSPPRR